MYTFFKQIFCALHQRLSVRQKQRAFVALLSVTLCCNLPAAQAAALEMPVPKYPT